MDHPYMDSYGYMDIRITHIWMATVTERNSSEIHFQLLQSQPEARRYGLAWPRWLSIIFIQFHCWQICLLLILISQNKGCQAAKKVTSFQRYELLTLTSHHLILIIVLTVGSKPISPPGLLATVQPVTPNFPLSPNLTPKSYHHLTDFSGKCWNLLPQYTLL